MELWRVFPALGVGRSLSMVKRATLKISPNPPLQSWDLVFVGEPVWTNTQCGICSTSTLERPGPTITPKADRGAVLNIIDRGRWKSCPLIPYSGEGLPKTANAFVVQDPKPTGTLHPIRIQLLLQFNSANSFAQLASGPHQHGRNTPG